MGAIPLSDRAALSREVAGRWPASGLPSLIADSGQDLSSLMVACLRHWFGEVRPAATMISAALLDPRMRIEIEVTALKQPPAA